VQLTDEIMRALLEKGELDAPITLPQTREKGTAKLYFTEQGRLEIKGFRQTDDAK